jgi:hypothetical protein
MPTPDGEQPSGNAQSPDPADDPAFDAKDWVMRKIDLNSPVENRRAELRRLAETAGFEDVDVRNLGAPEFWEMRFSTGANARCATAAEAETWVTQFVNDCHCQLEPGQFVAVVEGNRIAARFRLQQGVQHELGELF